MLDFKKIIRNQETRIKIANSLHFIPDELYLKLLYRVKAGKRLNLENPVGFTEKLNWLKIHNRRLEYSKYVDKIYVKNIIDEKIGPGHTIPTIGAWESFSKIDFSELPDEFVLKCNHDSGSVRIIHDKSNINYLEMASFYKERLNRNPANTAREYPYGGVKPMIMAEPIVGDLASESVNDYKFFCFHGEPKVMYIATDRSKNCKFDWFDMDFNHLDIINIHPNSDKDIVKPKTFDEMRKVATTLSKGIPFVRIDLYEINGKVYFGEYTFFHAGGLWPMSEKWEKILGSYIDLSK